MVIGANIDNYIFLGIFMSNEVENYPFRSPSRSGLGSLGGDHMMFSLHDARTDSTISKDIRRLIEALHKAYSHHNPVAITRLLRQEKVLGQFKNGGVTYTVHVRLGSHGAVAFYAHPTNGFFQTVLMGAESNPPLNGDQSWWRGLIRPRLRDMLGL